MRRIFASAALVNQSRCKLFALGRVSAQRLLDSEEPMAKTQAYRPIDLVSCKSRWLQLTIRRNLLRRPLEKIQSLGRFVDRENSSEFLMECRENGLIFRR